MAQVTVPLTLIPNGWYMSWEMFTQAAFNICVTLQDSETIYVNNKCRQSSSFGTLAEGFEQVQGNNVNLVINISQSSSVSAIAVPNVIQAPTGEIVAYLYTVLVEDSLDKDYNDLYVSIAAWAKKG